MTENDKALVARLRDVYRVKVPNYIDDAADRIEALAAENERLRAWRDAVDDALTSHMTAANSFPDAQAAVRWLIEREQHMALDPAISTEARALVASNDAKVVAWLRSKDAYEMASQSEHGDLLTLADAIERGDHYKGETQ